MNHYLQIHDLLCEICEGSKWKKIYKSGVSGDWGTDNFRIIDCHNYHPFPKDEIILEISIINKSDDSIVNEILSFLKKPLLQDNETFFISTIHKACESIENDEPYMWVTKNDFDRVEGKYTKNRALRLCIVDSITDEYYINLEIESLSNKEIFDSVMNQLEKIEKDFILNSKIEDLIREMARLDIKEFIEIHADLYKLLREKFEKCNS